MPHKDDATRIRHMYEYANNALTIIKGKTRPDLDNELAPRLALVHCIEIIGEAASKVSKAGQKTYSDIPWKKIINMRNRIAHVYFDINHDVVWETTTKDLPPLLASLRKILGKEGAGQ